MLCATCEAGVTGNSLIPNLGKRFKSVHDSVSFLFLGLRNNQLNEIMLRTFCTDDSAFDIYIGSAS